MSISSSFMPRVVTAGVPSLTPLVTNGEARIIRNCILVACNVSCIQTLLQLLYRLVSCSDRSTSIRWLSVPPDTILTPLLHKSVSRVLIAFLTTCSAYTLKARAQVLPLKHTALPAITCIRGPPWIPGNTALLKLELLCMLLLKQESYRLLVHGVSYVLLLLSHLHTESGLDDAPAGYKTCNMCHIYHKIMRQLHHAISLNFLKSIVLA